MGLKSGIRRRIRGGRIDDNEGAIMEGRAGASVHPLAVACFLAIAFTAGLLVGQLRPVKPGWLFGGVANEAVPMATWMDHRTGFVVGVMRERLTEKQRLLVKAAKEERDCDGLWRYYFDPKGRP